MLLNKVPIAVIPINVQNNPRVISDNLIELSKMYKRPKDVK